MSRRPFGGAYFAGEGAMRKVIAALLVLALPWAASAQVVTSGNGPSVMVTGTNASGATVTLPVPASITVGINGVVSGGGGTPTGPAGTPNINVVTVQGIAGATPIPITGTISASTSGTATTAAPTYVNNTSNPLSLNLAGGMRVDGSGVTQPVSGTFFQGTQPVSGTFFQGTQPVSIATMPSTPVTGTFFQGTQPVSIATMPSTPVTGTFFQTTQPVSIATDTDTIGSGSIAALNATVAVALSGKSAMRIQITGTWVGTLQFEGTVDGTNWIAVNAVQAGSTTIPQNTATNGVFSPTPAGFVSFRVNATAWTSGTATVSLRASAGAGGVYLNQALPAFAVIPAFKIDQTTPGTTNLVQISGTVPVSGTFFQGTQPVSIATMPSTPVTGTFFQGTQPVSIATLPALTAGAAVIGAVTQSGTWNIGTVTTLPALATGANTIGAVNIAAAQTVAVTQATAANLNATVVQATPANLQVTETPATPTAFVLNSAATTNATSVKASAGTIYSITISNVGAAAVFVKIYNLATTPTVGTSTIALTIPVAASGVANIQFAATGMRFGTGIALATTNLVADTDTTVVAAGQIKVLMSYL